MDRLESDWPSRRRLNPRPVVRPLGVEFEARRGLGAVRVGALTAEAIFGPGQPITSHTRR